MARAALAMPPPPQTRGRASDGNIPPAGLQGRNMRPSAVHGHLPLKESASAGDYSMASQMMRQGHFGNVGRLRRESAESQRGSGS